MNLSKNALAAIQSSFTYRKPVLFLPNESDTVYETTIVDVSDNFVVIQNPVPYTQITNAMKSTQYSLQCEMIRFSSDSIETDGENIIFPITKLKEIQETREAERVAFDGKENAICEIKNPYDNETIIEKPVIEMSSAGLSLRSAKPSKLFSPGQSLPSLKVLLEGDTYLTKAAEVVYARKMIDIKGKQKVQVGLKFENE